MKSEVVKSEVVKGESLVTLLGCLEYFEGMHISRLVSFLHHSQMTYPTVIQCLISDCTHILRNH